MQEIGRDGGIKKRARSSSGKGTASHLSAYRVMAGQWSCLAACSTTRGVRWCWSCRRLA